MRRADLARWCAALVLAGVVGPRAATAEPLPTGRIGAVLGGKTGTGALSSRLGLGFAAGFEAGYAPLRPTQTIGLGVDWAITWTYFLSGSAPVSDKLRMVEFDLGARLRLVVGPRRTTVLFVGGGAQLARTNEPVFDVGTRSYVGPWGAAGVERSLLGAVVTGSLRFGVLANGQGTLGLMLGVGFGR
ncbi:MAG: hypothetical protein R3B06_23565 [Kofleriaceae bacterium]